MIYEKNTIYRGELPKKGAWAGCRFKKRFWKKKGGGGFFEGRGWYTNPHYVIEGGDPINFEK